MEKEMKNTYQGLGKNAIIMEDQKINHFVDPKLGVLNILLFLTKIYYYFTI